MLASCEGDNEVCHHKLLQLLHFIVDHHVIKFFFIGSLSIALRISLKTAYIWKKIPVDARFPPYITHSCNLK